MATSSKTSAPAEGNDHLDSVIVGLGVLGLACAGFTEVHLWPAKKGCTAMWALGAGSSASFVLPFAVSGLVETGTTLPTDMLSAAVKGGGSGTLTFSDKNGAHCVDVVRGKVRTSILGASAATATPPSMEKPAGENVQEVVMTAPLLAYLRSVLPVLKIERTHSALPEVMAYVRIMEGKSAWASTADSYQFCWVTRSLKGEDGAGVLPSLQLSLPYDRFSSIMKDLPVANCTFYVAPETLTVVGKGFSFQIALAVVDADSALDPEVAYKKAREMDKTVGEACVIPCADLRDFVDRSRVLFSAGATVAFTPGAKGKGAFVVVEGSRGSTKLAVKDAVLSSGFALDYRYLGTVLRLAGADAASLEFLVAEGSMLIARGSVNYVAWLASAEGGAE